MKTYTVKLESIKDSDGWSDMAHTLKFKSFEKQNPNLNEDELNDKFYTEVISKYFKYGEYANIEIKVDENFNIVGGKFIPSGRD